MHNRPKAFVEHCLHRLVNAEDVDTPKQMSEGMYNISGYITKLGNATEMPSCDCIDWKSHHWPCKHIFKAISVCSWDALSVLIRQSQYLTIDNYCVDKNLIDVSQCTVPATHCDEMSLSNIGEEITTVGDVACECRELLQEITTCTYSDLTVDCLQMLRDSLSATLKTLRSQLPSEHGLAFLPQKRKRRDVPKQFTKRRLHSTVDMSQADSLSANAMNNKDDRVMESSAVVEMTSDVIEIEVSHKDTAVPVLSTDSKEVDSSSVHALKNKDDRVMESSAEVEMKSNDDSESDAFHKSSLSMSESTHSKQAHGMCADELSDEVLITAARQHESQASEAQGSQCCDVENDDKMVTPIEIHDEDEDTYGDESVVNKSIARVSLNNCYITVLNVVLTVNTIFFS